MPTTIGGRATLGRYVHTPIVRFKHSLSDDSYIGLLYTGRELEHSNNRVIGFDEDYRVTQSALISTTGFLSWATDGPGLQTLSGHTFGARFASDSRDLTYSLTVREVSNDFRADLGYVTRTGVATVIGYFDRFMARVPDLLTIEVHDDEAIDTTRRLIRLGFPVGPSSGLNVQAALSAAQKLGADAQIVTVFRSYGTLFHDRIVQKVTLHLKAQGRLSLGFR